MPYRFLEGSRSPLYVALETFIHEGGLTELAILSTALPIVVGSRS